MQILNNNKNISVGNIYPSRDYTFVKDTCSAIYMLSKIGKKNNGEIFHIGNNKTYKIQYIINKIKTLMDSKQKIKTNKLRVRPKNGEVDILRCDNKKIKNTVGWKAQFSFEKGLIETIDWFKKNKNRFVSNLYNI